MAAIADILQREAGRQPNEVWLYKEGMFWRAYEQSAYLLAIHSNLKPQKKFIKAVNQEVVYVGFLETSWEKFMGQTAKPQEGEKEKIMRAHDTDTVGFADWKAQIKTAEQEVQEKQAKLTETEKKIIQRKQEQKRQREKLGKELPVYQVSYDLLKYYVTISRKMPRDVKYTIAQQLQDRLFDITLLTRRAQRAKEREQKLVHINKAIDIRLEAELQIRLLFDLKCISLKQYTLMSEQIISLEKHLENWKQYLLT